MKSGKSESSGTVISGNFAWRFRDMKTSVRILLLAAMSMTLAIAVTGCGKGKAKDGDPYVVGLNALEHGDYAKAVQMLTQAVNQKPDDHQRQSALGKSYLENKQPQEAIECFKKVIDLTKNDPKLVGPLAQSYFNLADAELALGKRAAAKNEPAEKSQAHYVAAEQWCRKALEKQPNAAHGYLVLSNIYAARPEPEKALEEADRALKMDPLLVDGYFIKASLLGFKDPKQAITACELGIGKLKDKLKKDQDAAKAREEDPKKLEAELAAIRDLANKGIFRLSQLQGRILMQQPGKDREARDVFTSIADIAPPAERWNVHYQIGLLCLKDNRWDDANKQAEAITKVDPQKTFWAAYLRGRVALAQAASLKDTKPKEQQELISTAVHELAAVSGLKWSEGLLYYGHALSLKEGSDEQALTALRNALDNLDETSRSLEPQIRYLMAMLLMQKGSLEYREAALAHVNEALKMKPNDPDLRTLRSKIHQLMGHFAEAQTDAEWVTQAEPASSQAKLDSAYLLYIRGQLDQALERCEEAIKLSADKDAKAFHLRGIIYQRKQMRHEAVASFEKAVALNPQFAQAYMDLAQVYVENDEKDKAIELLKNYMKMQPDSAQAAVILAGIYDRDKNADLAMQTYNEALRRDPKYLSAYRVARLYLLKGQTDDAIQKWREAVAIAAASKAPVPAFQVDLILALMLSDRTQDALQQAQELRQSIGNQKGSYSLYEIVALVYAGEYAKARTVLENAKDVSLNRKTPITQLIDQHEANPVAGKKVLTAFAYATIEYNDGSYVDAIRRLEEIRREAPKSLLVLSNLIMFYFQRGDYSRLEQLCNDMIAIDEQFAAPHYYLGLLAQSNKKLDEATRQYELAAQRDERFADARLRLARLKLDAKQYSDVIMLADQVLAFDDKNDEANALKYDVYIMTDNKEKLKDLGSNILNKDANNIIAKRAQIHLAVADGKNDEVITACDDALAAHPGNTEFLRLKAEAFVSRNKPRVANTPSDLEQAVSILEKALQINDANPALYVSLSRILRSDQRMLGRAIWVLQQGLDKIPNSQVLQIEIVDIYLSLGELAKAEEQLGPILKDPGNMYAALLKAQLDFYKAANLKDEAERTKGIDAAVDEAKKQAASPDLEIQFSAYTLLGRMYYQGYKGKNVEATQAFEAALKLKDRRREPCDWLARIYFANGQYESSSRILEKLCGWQENAADLARLAISRQMEPNVAAAERAARQALDRQPDFDPSRLVLASILLDLGKVEDAIKLVRESAKMEARQLAAYEELIRGLSQDDRHAVCIELNKGLFYLLSLFNADVPEHYEAARKRANSDNLFLMTALGESQMNARRFEDATKTFSAITRLQPDYVPAWKCLGDLYEAQRKLAEAIEAYKVAAEKAPKDAQIAQRLGLFYRTVDKYAEARKEFQRALVLEPNNAGVLYMLGEASERLNLIDAAVEYYDKAIKLAPNDRETVSAYNNAAWYYATRKDPNLRTAKSYARKAKELLPELLAVRDTLGWVLYLSKDLEGAKQELKTAALGLKDDPTVQYHYARVLSETNEAELAAKTLEAVIDLTFPEKAEAQALLAKLRGVKKE